MKHSVPGTDPVFLAFQAAVAGRYSIDRELGRGGMGIVYLAHEVHLDRMVAIKLLPPERATDPALRDRFVREARLAAKLSHPNIIPIHAVADAGDFVYYVMSFVDGETLTERVRTRGPLSGSEGARVLREVAWALGHAHAQGLVHRDVKPDNILLEAGTGRALVADFGIAAVAGEGGGAGAMGTPEFMSPEQASGTVVDARSDLYSFGATAFFALSGRIPFEGRSATEIIARHITEAPPALVSSGSHVSRRIAALVDRCLAKDPAQRPPTADAVADLLGVAMEQRRELPVALRAFVKRNSRMDGGGTLLGTFGLAMSAVTLARVFGGEWGWVTLAGGATLGPLGFMVNAARRLLRQGFSYADVAPAYRREREQIGEELAVDRHGRSVLLERLLRAAGIAGITVMGAGVVSMVAVGMSNITLAGAARGVVNGLAYLIAIGGMVGLPSLLGYLALLQRRMDVDTGFWARIWNGPAGRLAFSIARRTGVARPAATAVTHRATELSLGLAAEQLWDTLPKDTRQALGDVPAIVARLQDDARQLRARYESVQDALAGDARDRDDLDDLRATRDTLQARLGEAVGALEAVRLGLLRLHAGSTTVEGFTTHLALASDFSVQVERLINAHEDVERSLSLPRAAITPA